MTEAPELDRDALLELLDQVFRAEAVTNAPPAAERGDWLYGSAGFTEPDEHGWMHQLPRPTYGFRGHWYSGAWPCCRIRQ